MATAIDPHRSARRGPALDGSASRWSTVLATAWSVSLWAAPAASAQSPAGPPPDPPTMPTDPAVVFEERVERYRVRAATLAEVVATLNEMRLQGPAGPPSQGLTTYRIEPEWRIGASGGLCRVTNLRVRVEVVVTMPDWPMVVDRPFEERRAWGTIERAIRDHEQVHRDLVVAASDALAADLRGRETRGCRALRQVVAGAISSARVRLEDAHAEHDRTSPFRLPIGGGATAPDSGDGSAEPGYSRLSWLGPAR